MKRKIFLGMLLFAGSVSAFTSCQPEEESVAKAVLASASSLTFAGQNADPQMITVYSDATWTADVPEWVTIDPTTGSGTTDVTVSVSDNLRDGTLDNPRTANLVFKGSTLASQDIVVINQDGDKFRDIKTYTVTEVAALADGTIICIPESQVMAITTAGVVVSDGTTNLYVVTTESVTIGDKVYIKGDKGTVNSLPAVTLCDEITVQSSGTPSYPQAKDISADVDKYNPTSMEYISARGQLDGTSLVIEGATYSVSALNAPESYKMEEYNGHDITVTGYFGGLASPYIYIMLTAIEDHGIVEIIAFQEDFEWLNPWATSDNLKQPAGMTVETDNIDAYCPQLSTPKVDGVSALEALEAKGYQFLRVWHESHKQSECIYLQQNYLKFGKTGYHAGIILPKITAAVETEKYRIDFDWCPMRQGTKTDGKIDPVNLIVIVENNGVENEFLVPTHDWENNHKLEWIHASVDLSDVTIDANSIITIKQLEWEEASTANRWFLDNIKIVQQ